MTHYIVGLHHPHIDDNVIVEMYAEDAHERVLSIVGRKGELKALGYWRNGENWNFAKGERKEEAERGKAPRWLPVVDDTDRTNQPKRPHIDDSDPNNPIFRTEVSNHRFSFSIRYVPKERQEHLVSIVHASIHEAYILGQKEARAEIQAAIRNALML